MKRRFTVAEYERMGQAGILSEDDRVELIDGEIIEMSPIGPPHSAVASRLNATFAAAVGTRAIVSTHPATPSQRTYCWSWRRPTPPSTIIVR